MKKERKILPYTNSFLAIPAKTTLTTARTTIGTPKNQVGIVTRTPEAIRKLIPNIDNGMCERVRFIANMPPVIPNAKATIPIIPAINKYIP